MFIKMASQPTPQPKDVVDQLLEFIQSQDNAGYLGESVPQLELSYSAHTLHNSAVNSSAIMSYLISRCHTLAMDSVLDLLFGAQQSRPENCC